MHMTRVIPVAITLSMMGKVEEEQGQVQKADNNTKSLILIGQ